MSVLEVSGLYASYGDAAAIQGLDLDANEGEIVVLLGRNGMGKTSTMRAVMGLPEPRVTAGSIKVLGTEVVGRDSHMVARLGVGYVPQGRRVFASLSVEENLRIVARKAKNHRDHWTVEHIWELFPRLQERCALTAGHLSGGEQQMLAIGRALVTSPRLLLLDEPSEGLAPAIVRGISETVQALRGQMTVLIAEQDIRFALALADRIFVLDRGTVIASGPPELLDEDPDFKRRALGVG